MKNSLMTILMLGSFLISGCGNSNYSSSSDEAKKTPITDPLPTHNQKYISNANYVSNHCADISGKEHMFYGYMKNMKNKHSYKNFLETQTDCKSYNGWVKYQNGNNTFYQYQKYEGTSNCSFWSKQPAGITVDFFKGYKNTATIAIDSTGNGWDSSGPGYSQGFPVNRLILNGQIDCTQKDLTIHSYTQRGWFSVQVPQNKGNKNSMSMRAEVYFNGSSLGKYQLRRSN